MNRIEYLNYIFEGQDITNGSTHFARSLKSSSLEIDTFSFEVRSDDTTLTQFVRNTPLTYYHDGNQIGIFYVQKISRVSKSAYRFECTSTVGLLDESYHNGGVYTGQTVDETVRDICAPFPVIVKTNIQNIKLYGWLPIATKRENLTQVLFAIGATLKVDYGGIIRIEGLWDGQSAEIGADRMYSGGTVEYATPVTQVIVTEHGYNQTATETVDLFEGTTAAGDKITFDEPCYDLVAEGFQITESGANYAIVTAGSGKLTGKKYVHTTRYVTKNISLQRRDLIEQSDSIVKVQNATLVSLANSNAVAERLVSYYSCNERIVNGVLLQSETAGDVVNISHPYGNTVDGCIESSDITISKKLKSNETILVGYKPQNIGNAEYYDRSEILTQSGQWTVPEGVTSVRAVLIGGGQGGQAGQAGKEGTKDATTVYTQGQINTESYCRFRAFSSGGDGGEPGAPGKGGKIFQSTIHVTPGQIIDVEIGGGGEGGQSNGAMGALGSDTIFGELSSANGSTDDNGFTDTFTNTDYALPGVNDGKKGGKGTGGTGADSTDLVTETVGSWQPGKSPMNYIDVEYRSGSGIKGRIFLYDGLGGGAAWGSNGGDGQKSYKEDENSSYSFLAGGKGGKGATPPARSEIPEMLGRGGYPGHGAGGGGGRTAYTTNKIGYYEDYIAREPSPGEGGTGGKGGKGAKGCVILYYSKPKPGSQGGALRDKNDVLFLDRYGRQIVV